MKYLRIFENFEELIDINDYIDDIKDSSNIDIKVNTQIIRNSKIITISSTEYEGSASKWLRFKKFTINEIKDSLLRFIYYLKSEEYEIEIECDLDRPYGRSWVAIELKNDIFNIQTSDIVKREDGYHIKRYDMNSPIYAMNLKISKSNKLKKFQESIDESDLDDVLDILQYFGDTKPHIWLNDFVNFSKGMLVVYFNEGSNLKLDELQECNQRLESLGYQLVSSDFQDDKLWFLVMSSELVNKYKNQLHFRFIEDLKFTKKYSNYSFCNKEYPSGDTIYITTNNNNEWQITDSITEVEETTDNKVVANIYFLQAQHKVQGIIGSLSRGF